MSKQVGGGDVLACNLGALTLAQREVHQALASRLFSEAVEERTELSNGYAFRFRPEHYDDVAAFIANERRCCPFFTFVLEVAADPGPIWLRITGHEGAKAILQQELLA